MKDITVGTDYKYSIVDGGKLTFDDDSDCWVCPTCGGVASELNVSENATDFDYTEHGHRGLYSPIGVECTKCLHTFYDRDALEQSVFDMLWMPDELRAAYDQHRPIRLTERGANFLVAGVLVWLVLILVIVGTMEGA